ncbi:MAG: hypothetical protein KJ666_07925 [Bacteroidetes bacterium]|nr:hypothetical protein [Bacteroidota bacterium]MBU2586457.1 hypothetical protein [Bacteroidota bacterium]
MENITWSPEEKKVARKIFDKAYQNEVEEIKNLLEKKVQKIKSGKNIWDINDFLTERRISIDKKYDYRYSRLIIVFGILLNEEYLTENDLKGLSEEKIEMIKNVAKGF